MNSLRASLEDLAATWEGERVVMDHHAPTDAWIFICMHSSRLGPAAGGTHMKVYATPQGVLSDGFRLASTVTLKMAVAGVPLGGNKGDPACSRGGAREFGGGDAWRRS